MQKYIFLDFNGTVLDDLDLCRNLLNEMLVQKNCTPVSEEKYKEIFCFPVIDYYRKAGFDFSKYTFGELADYFIKEYTKRNVVECHIFDDVKDFLNLAHKAGYKVVLCSASKLNLLLDQLKSFGIDTWFDDVIGLDNHHAVSKLQLALDYVKSHSVALNESFFIGDTTHDAEVAKACELTSILVKRGHQNEEVLSKMNCPIEENLLACTRYLKK